MTYKTILVHVDTSARAEVRIRLAIALAQQHEAHLVGLATAGTVLLADTYGLDGTAAYMAMALAELDKLAAEAADRFEQRAKAAGLSSFESRVAPGDPAHALCVHARYADLVVLGQADQSRASAASPPELPATVVLGAGRPVLLIPHAGDFPTLGKNILFPWNASRESARAARDALPFLVRADTVRVAVFDARANQQGHGAEPGSDVALYLARHGVKVAVNRESSDGDVGSAVLSRACDFGTDLIVMGAYGHSRLREMVLGGVSKTLLEHMTVPVLMAH